MISPADIELAEALRAEWHHIAASFDRNVAIGDVREILVAASWNDSTFAKISIGLECGLSDLAQIGIVSDYRWVLCKSAYDLISEPLYQHVLLGVLCGLWEASEPQNRRAEVFGRIAVRQPNGFLISNGRAEPVAIDHAISPTGWIQVPFAWDDLLQLSLASLFDSLRFDSAGSLADLLDWVEGLGEDPIDWSPAHSTWNGLIARALLGRLRIPHEEEWMRLELLCARTSLLQPYIAHQRSIGVQDLANSLAYLAKVFTIAHEAAHIVRSRQRVSFSDIESGEIDADKMAMSALWNHRLAIESEVRRGQDFESLWFASGLTFFFGLLVFGNLLRCTASAVDVSSLKGDRAQHELTRYRMSVWMRNAIRLCGQEALNGNDQPLKSVVAQKRLMSLMISYCNALLDYGDGIVPRVLEETRNALFRWRP